VVGGLFALRASLFPLSTEARKVKFAPGITEEDDFRATVSKVDAVFRDDWQAKGLQPARGQMISRSRAGCRWR